MKNIQKKEGVNKVLNEVYPGYENQLKDGLVEVLTNKSTMNYLFQGAK